MFLSEISFVVWFVLSVAFIALIGVFNVLAVEEEWEVVSQHVVSWCV